MDFSIDTEQVGDNRHVIALGGEVDLYTAPELKSQMLELIANGASEVVVDFTNTTFIDSTTLGVLVSGVKRLREKGGRSRSSAATATSRRSSRSPVSTAFSRSIRPAPRPSRGLTPKKLPRSRAAAAAAMLGAVLAAAGCGTGGVDTSSNVAGGKELFVSKCGSCHTLADAGTTGKVGRTSMLPSASRRAGLRGEHVRQVVRDQIHLPSPAEGDRGFPRDAGESRHGIDADAVSAYVASVAGVTQPPGPPPPPPPGPPPPPPPPSPTTTGQATTTGPTPSGGDAAKGKSLFASLGCASCHSIDGSSGVGPTLKGLFGTQVQLTNGKAVTADDAYLLESIEDPDAEIVKGFQPGIMSGVIKPHQVAESDARDLIAYIKTLK